MTRRRAVVAIGGNSLISDPARQSVQDQYEAAAETNRHIAALITAGWDVALVHGNGPQVGFILRRSELARDELHEVPLDVCVADSQGAIGYLLQASLANELARRGVTRSVVTVVTQVEVSRDDPAFASPTKPIGSFMQADEARRRAAEEGWVVASDANRGWRRVVASPYPRRIVEIDAIRSLLDGGFVVVSAGGGGIPVAPDAAGGPALRGVPAVIDKDLAAALLARELGADLLVISTGVEKVALHFGTPEQVWLDEVTFDEAKSYLADGTHFAPGSMAPKIEAVLDFLAGGGERAIITNPHNLSRALAGETGTRFRR